MTPKTPRTPTPTTATPTTPTTPTPTTPVRKSLDARTGYDLWAATYDDTENPVVALDLRVLGQYLGPMAGAHIVDAGCGTGRHTLTLAEHAASVTAVDFSQRMLARTRAKLEHAGRAERVALVLHDLHVTPYPLASQSADGIVCALVGEHLVDLGAVFAEFARLLVPGGWLLFSVYHPLLALLGAEANFTVPASEPAHGDVEYRLGAEKHLVSDYVNALRAAGLTLDVLREPRVDDALCRDVPKAGKYLGKPLLLVMRGFAPPVP